MQIEGPKCYRKIEIMLKTRDSQTRACRPMFAPTCHIIRVLKNRKKILATDDCLHFNFYLCIKM